MKVGDFFFALDKMKEIELATRKLSAYVNMIGMKENIDPVSMNVAIEIVRRASVEVSMKPTDPNSEAGKKQIEDMNELADLFLDHYKSRIKIRSKDHSHLPDMPTEIDLGDN